MSRNASPLAARSLPEGAGRHARHLKFRARLKQIFFAERKPGTACHITEPYCIEDIAQPLKRSTSSTRQKWVCGYLETNAAKDTASDSSDEQGAADDSDAKASADPPAVGVS